MDLIDRIRKDIQDRLDAVLGEADKLRKALVALDPRGGSGPARSASDGASTRAPGASAPRSGGSSRSTASRPRRSSGRRTPPGATKRRVLDALSDGSAKTAGEVAAATGVARGTVSTTLSKLVKTGEVVKAERGYRLPGSRPSRSTTSA
jgi:DNA-binding transcriptional ArsR family regulator